MRRVIPIWLLIVFTVSFVTAAGEYRFYWERVDLSNAGFERPEKNGLIPGWPERIVNRSGARPHHFDRRKRLRRDTQLPAGR